MAPTQLLVDLAGVLAAFDRQHRISALARLSGLAEDHVDERIYGSGFVDAADAGSIDAAGVRDAIVRRLGLPSWSAAADAAWMAAFAEDAEVVAVLDTVDPAVRVGLLSNNDALVGALVGSYLPAVDHRCDAVVVSGVTGVRKPSAGAYLAGREALGDGAAACVFVDDSQSNVDGGLAVGIDALLFTGPAQLAVDLARLGLVAG